MSVPETTSTSDTPLFEHLASTREWQPPLPDPLGVLTRSTQSRAVSYSTESLEALDSQCGQNWWNEHRIRWALNALHSRSVHALVEVGAGSGSMAVRLAQAGLDVSAVEPLYEGARRIHARGIPAFCGLLSDLDLPTDSLPAIGYFDVLEHLQHPDHELQEACRVLEPGGILLVTVPSFQWLWSHEDVYAGHYRRYTRATLTDACARAGIMPLRTEYLFATLVPAALLTRRLPYLLASKSGRRGQQTRSAIAKQLDPHPSITQLANGALAAETLLAKHVALPFGLSVAGVFHKAV